MESMLNMLTGAAYIWFHAIVIITGLILKLYKPEKIENIGKLNTAILMVVIAILLPQVVGIITMFFNEKPSDMSDLKNFTLGVSYGTKIVQLLVALLTCFAIYNLWSSIKFEKIEVVDSQL